MRTEFTSDICICVQLCVVFHVLTRKLSLNLIESWQRDKVIHDSWHLIALYGLTVVHLCFLLMHTCAVMFKGLVFILSRKRNPPPPPPPPPPYHTHSNEFPLHKHKQQAHIHNFADG